mmetsp:Transcript_10575/g.39861  ORF Transcript_10575/g.39861 Transcript_10575/m.39861 type:complete len:678 (+) Transcript_10575:1665-3698(+)
MSGVGQEPCSVPKAVDDVGQTPHVQRATVQRFGEAGEELLVPEEEVRPRMLVQCLVELRGEADLSHQGPQLRGLRGLQVVGVPRGRFGGDLQDGEASWTEEAICAANKHLQRPEAGQRVIVVLCHFPSRLDSPSHLPEPQQQPAGEHPRDDGQRLGHHGAVSLKDDANRFQRPHTGADGLQHPLGHRHAQRQVHVDQHERHRLRPHGQVEAFLHQREAALERPLDVGFVPERRMKAALHQDNPRVRLQVEGLGLGGKALVQLRQVLASKHLGVRRLQLLHEAQGCVSLKEGAGEELEMPAEDHNWHLLLRCPQRLVELLIRHLAGWSDSPAQCVQRQDANKPVSLVALRPGLDGRERVLQEQPDASAELLEEDQVVAHVYEAVVLGDFREVLIDAALEDHSPKHGVVDVHDHALEEMQPLPVDSESRRLAADRGFQHALVCLPRVGELVVLLHNGIQRDEHFEDFGKRQEHWRHVSPRERALVDRGALAVQSRQLLDRVHHEAVASIDEVAQVLQHWEKPTHLQLQRPLLRVPIPSILRRERRIIRLADSSDRQLVDKEGLRSSLHLVHFLDEEREHQEDLAQIRVWSGVRAFQARQKVGHQDALDRAGSRGHDVRRVGAESQFGVKVFLETLQFAMVLLHKAETALQVRLHLVDVLERTAPLLHPGAGASLACARC